MKPPLTSPHNLDPGSIASCHVIAFTEELAQQAITSSSLIGTDDPENQSKVLLPAIIMQSHGVIMSMIPGYSAGFLLLPPDCPDDVVALASDWASGVGEHLGTICARHLLIDPAIQAHLDQAEAAMEQQMREYEQHIAQMPPFNG